MKTRWIISSVMVAAFALTGCSTQETTATKTVPVPGPTASVSASPTASVQTTTAAPTSNRNERGQLIKGIGQVASFQSDTTHTDTLTFKVTSIKPITCDATSGTQPKGTALAVSLEIQTTAEFDGPLTVNGTPGQISFGPYYWKGYTPDGTRMNTVDTNISHSCLADATLLVPEYIGKGEKVKGIVVLDVSTPTGSVSYSPWDDDGWIWKYSSK